MSQKHESRRGHRAAMEQLRENEDAGRVTAPVLDGPLYVPDVLWLELKDAEAARHAWNRFNDASLGDGALPRALRYIASNRERGASLKALFPERALEHHHDGNVLFAIPGHGDKAKFSGIHYVRLPSGEDPTRLCNELADDNRVSYVGRPAVQYPLDAPPQRGTLRWLSSFLSSFLHTDRWWLNQCGFPSVWPTLERGTEVPGPIAVIDQGGYIENPVVDECDGAGTTGPCIETRPLEGGSEGPSTSSHATAVAAVIAARRDPTARMLGCCSARVYLYNTWTSETGFDAERYVNALKDAVKMGVSVVNISLGSLVDDSKVKEQILETIRQGVIVVAAAGNHALASRPVYPAEYEGVIAVGASGGRGGRMPWSANRDYVYIMAPGEDILSVTAGNALDLWRGTSFAAPMVSAAIWLALHRRSDLTPEELLCVLARSVSGAGVRRRGTGYGRLDMSALAEAVKKPDVCS